jgi:hypothetical protein
LTVVLAVMVLGAGGYAWESAGASPCGAPVAPVGRRLLAAGGVSLGAAGLPALLVGVATNVFMLGLAEGRYQPIPVGFLIFMVALVAGPMALIILGILSAIGRRRAALGGGLLGLAGYVALFVVVVPFPHSSPGAELLLPASVGVVPAFVLLLAAAVPAPPPATDPIPRSGVSPLRAASAVILGAQTLVMAVGSTLFAAAVANGTGVMGYVAHPETPGWAHSTPYLVVAIGSALGGLETTRRVWSGRRADTLLALMGEVAWVVSVLIATGGPANLPGLIVAVLPASAVSIMQTTNRGSRITATG